MIGALLHSDPIQLSQAQFLRPFGINLLLAGMDGINKTPVRILVLRGETVRVHCRMICPGMVRQREVFIYKSYAVAVFL